MDINAIINASLPILGTILTGVITWFGTKANKLIKAKISTENYTKLKNVGQNAWFIGEEFFRLHPELKTSAESKAIMFAAEVRKKIPYVTDEELETLRQALAGEINKDKTITSSTSTTVYNSPIQAVAAVDTAADQSTQQAVQQGEIIIKYFTKDGVELQPVSSGSTSPAQ